MTDFCSVTSHRITRGLLMAGLCLLIAACGGKEPACEAVQGTVAGRSVPVLNDAGVPTGFQVEKATVAGSVAGTSSATFTVVRADEGGTMHLTGSHTFWDGADQFLFRTRDEGQTTPDGRVENQMTIIEGATGSLTTTGAVDPKTGTLTLNYEGELCRQ